MASVRLRGVAGACVVALLAVGVARGAPVAAADAPVVSLGDASGLERDAVTGSVFVPVFLSEPAPVPVTISFASADDTAVAGVDYSRWGTTAAPRTVTIPVGSVQTTINVPVLADAVVEGDERFSVTVTSVVGGDAVVGDGTGVATIVDADEVSVTNPAITVSSGTVVEGDAGQRRAQFHVHLSRPPVTNVTIAYRTVDGSGTAGVDFTAKLPGTVVFAPGQISKTIDVAVLANTSVDGERDFRLVVAIAGGSPVEELDMSGVAMIVDDDSAPDTAPPTLSLPNDLSLTATSQDGAIATWDASAIDDNDGPLPTSCTPPSGSLIPSGVTSVSCSATDAAGNTATGTFDVTVGVYLSGAMGLGSGEVHSCAITATAGLVKCWGYNNYGQLGNASVTYSATPTDVAGITGATAIDLGSYHSCVLLDDHSVRCWGNNISGRLGNGSTTSSAAPVTVTGITTATAISAGGAHTCALLADGSVECWGQNVRGQLGNGSTTGSTTPVTVTGITGATSISTGGEHSCAVVTGGVVKCWGYNSRGQLGNGSTTGSTTPVTVTGITGASSVSLGSAHSCAAVPGTGVMCWGSGGSFQLGNGVAANSPTPVAVAGVGDVIALSAGSDHVCVALPTGTSMCWGRNDWGKIGDGNTVRTYAPSPSQVLDVDGATALSLGSEHSCALTDERVLRCWGWNNYGQIGTGNTGAIAPASTVIGFE